MAQHLQPVDLDEVIFGEFTDDDLEVDEWASEASEGPVFSFSSLLDDDDDYEVFGGEDLEDEGSYGLDDGLIAPRPSPVNGRVAMASRVRRMASGQASGDESYGAGWYGGYLQCALDQGMVTPEQAKETFGGLGLAKLAGKGLGGAVKLLGQAGRGFVGQPEQTPEESARQLGQAARESSALPRFDASSAGQALGQWLRGSLGLSSGTEEAGPAPGVPIEADSERLPPTYVADDEGVEDAIDQTEEESGSVFASNPFEVTDSFGASFRVGAVEPVRRESTRKAVSSAAAKGVTRLRRANRSVRPTPLLEDVEATPVLYGDGSIIEPVYGRMQMLPCPSCAPMREDAVRYGGTSRCGVCDGAGAILVPDSDVDAYGASYGLMLLGLLGTAAGAAAGEAFRSGALFPEGKAYLEERMDEWFPVEDEVESEADPVQAGEAKPKVRALINKRWQRDSKAEV